MSSVAGWLVGTVDGLDSSTVAVVVREHLEDPGLGSVLAGDGEGAFAVVVATGRTTDVCAVLDALTAESAGGGGGTSHSLGGGQDTTPETGVASLRIG